MAVWQNIWEFFFPRERILLVTTFDHDHYLRVKNILLSEGIPHRSRIKGGMRGRGQPHMLGGRFQHEYELYVRREDERRAAEAVS